MVLFKNAIRHSGQKILQTPPGACIKSAACSQNMCSWWQTFQLCDRHTHTQIENDRTDLLPPLRTREVKTSQWQPRSKCSACAVHWQRTCSAVLQCTARPLKCISMTCTEVCTETLVHWKCAPLQSGKPN